MALILQIETSTTSCSVALSQRGNVIALKELTERNVHASVLSTFIKEVFINSGYELSQIDAVAVSMGPGSYTGLRIGVSTAKGICYALDKPLISVDTLKAMASGQIKRSDLDDATYCPMIDARRMEVYTALYSAELDTLLPTAARIIEADAFADALANKPIVFFGDGAAKCKDVLSHNAGAVFIDDFNNSAADLTDLAYKKFLSGQFEDLAYFEPYYLKDFIIGPR